MTENDLAPNEVEIVDLYSPVSSFQIADKREPGYRLPLAPEAHRAGRPVGAPQEDRPQIRAAQCRLSSGYAPLSGEENEL